MDTKGAAILLAGSAWLIGLMGCAVISQRMMAEADSDITFAQLKSDTDRYQGQTVILGGHIIEVRNKPDATVILVLQSPLGTGQEPRSPDRSQGRFMLHCEGFLDPEVYAEGRTITVAGRVLGQIQEPIGGEPYVYPKLEAREIYLWERYEDLYRYQPPYRPLYYDPWYYRNRRYGYPYR
jgi:outer membrane lipoprotein